LLTGLKLIEQECGREAKRRLLSGPSGYVDQANVSIEATLRNGRYRQRALTEEVSRASCAGITSMKVGGRQPDQAV